MSWLQSHTTAISPAIDQPLSFFALGPGLRR
jgi:hypothetical protein